MTLKADDLVFGKRYTFWHEQDNPETPDDERMDHRSGQVGVLIEITEEVDKLGKLLYGWFPIQWDDGTIGSVYASELTEAN